MYDEAVDRLRAESTHPFLLRFYTDKSAESSVILTASAAKELYTFFEWGETTKRNSEEQMACLIGKRKDSLLAAEKVQAITLRYADAVTAVYTGKSVKCFSGSRSLSEQTSGRGTAWICTQSPKRTANGSECFRYRTAPLSDRKIICTAVYAGESAKKRMKAYYKGHFGLSQIRIFSEKGVLTR